MARARTYRQDVPCPECGSHWMRKDGVPKGRQAYCCGDCGRRIIPDAAYQRPSAADKERALAMYQDGSSLTSIARTFGVSIPAVSAWVKKGAPAPGADTSPRPPAQRRNRRQPPAPGANRP